tara:strand:+ start:337 stop:885 length:549 start_codon:yes stop_codon:yes gene_type:complete
VFKERIQEILDFTKSESPYRKANKGWINKDIFLDLSPSFNTLEKKSEDAKVTLFWSPISILISNIFLILFIGSIVVFSSKIFSKGKFEFIYNFNTQEIVKYEENKNLNTEETQDLNEFNNSKDQSSLEDRSSNIEISPKLKEIRDDDILNIKGSEQDIQKRDIKSSDETKIMNNRKSKTNFL